MACGRPNGIHRPALSSGQAHVLPRRLKIRSQSANGSAAKEESMSTTSSAPETEAPPAEPVADHEAADEFWGADTGATTAEYAITTLAACGFAALLVVILKSEPIKELVTGVIQTALGMGS
jgi:predicted cobalt transporter CbtA